MTQRPGAGPQVAADLLEAKPRHSGMLDLKVLAPAWMNACLQWDERTWCSCWRGAAEGASAGVVDLDVAAMGETRRRRGTAAASESPPECVARVGEVHQLCFLAWGPYLM